MKRVHTEKGVTTKSFGSVYMRVNLILCACVSTSGAEPRVPLCFGCVVGQLAFHSGETVPASGHQHPALKSKTTFTLTALAYRCINKH